MLRAPANQATTEYGSRLIGLKRTQGTQSSFPFAFLVFFRG
jgi:hypothetical protein